MALDSQKVPSIEAKAFTWLETFNRSQRTLKLRTRQATMRFDNLDSALGILMSIDDMIESVQQGKLIMDGAPEFGAQIGEYMIMVGDYAK